MTVTEAGKCSVWVTTLMTVNEAGKKQTIINLQWMTLKQVSCQRFLIVRKFFVVLSINHPEVFKLNTPKCNLTEHKN